VRRRGVAALVLLAAAVLLLPVQGTLAYYTAQATGTDAGAGTGAWCAVPSSVSESRLVRLSSLSTVTAGSAYAAIVPVSYNAAWNDGTAPAGTAASKTLGIRVWGCQESPAGSIRVTAWSGPTGVGTTTALTPTWTAGAGAVAPGTRLDPTQGLGSTIIGYASSASVGATINGLTGVGAGAARQYSWLVANGRTKTATTASPSLASCTRLLSAVTGSTCTIAMAGTPTNATVASVFPTTPWAAGAPSSVSYTAATAALQSSTGWASGTGYLDESCVAGLLLCSVQEAPTAMAPQTTSPAVTSTNGNALQWVVVQWYGSALPGADLAVEIVLQ
jgi:hypothetical protein